MKNYSLVKNLQFIEEFSNFFSLIFVNNWNFQWKVIHKLITNQICENYKKEENENT